MTKCLLIYLLLSNITLLSKGQPGIWTWIKGDSTDSNPGNFGTQGVPSPTNNPPGHYEPAEWKDKQGMFWFYGGYTYTSGGASDNIWMYNIQTNEWTWMKGGGPVGTTPVYGTMGVFNAANTPGFNAWCAASWVDTSGMFWLFGGSNGSGGAYNLLWKYDPGINQWAWIRGSTLVGNMGNYGVKGIPSALNDPPARWETSVTWVDEENNLWLFGGYGQFNDLWKYNISTNEWTWMSGSNTLNQQATYGTLGVPDPNNVPGARYIYARWKDKDGNFWLWGGYGYDAAGGIGTLNDLWKYDVITNEWAWMSGSDQVGNPGSVGTPCDLDPNYYPSSRYETRSCWTDANGNFWLFGGLGDGGETNDLWIYVPDSNAWSIVTSSPNLSGMYGTQGSGNASTHPPAKMGALAWTDDLHNLWLFSGGFIGPAVLRNDLWKYVIDPNCPFIEQTSASAFAASDTSLCEKFCIDFFDSSLNAVSWEWMFPGANPSSSTDQDPTTICYNNPGTFDVTLITTNSSGVSDTLTLFDYITVYTNPFAPTITQTGNVLTSSIADFYQWYLNTVIIPGATNQSITITQPGLYTVIIADSNGCTAQASIDASVVGIESLSNDDLISIHPNPSNGNFVIALSAGSAWAEMDSEITIEVINILGQVVYVYEEKISSTHLRKEIDLSKFESGVYFIGIKTGDVLAGKKLIINK